MKKKIGIVVIAMLAVLTLVACSAPADAAIVGTWAVESLELNGVSIDVAKLAETPGLDDATKSMMTSMKLTASADGKLKMEAAGTTSEGTWKADGSNFTITSDGTNLTTSIKDGKMTMDFQGMKLVLKKS